MPNTRRPTRSSDRAGKSASHALTKGKRVAHPRFSSRNVGEVSVADMITQINHYLGVMRDEIDAYGFPEFGNSLFADDGSSCVFNTRTTIQSAIMAHRFKKFERPNHLATQRRKAECAANWVTFERNHIQQWNWFQPSHTTRSAVYRALNEFPWGKKEFWSVYHKQTEINFTPGETFISRQGDTSVFSKLKNVQEWTVTIDAREDAAKVASINKSTLVQFLSWWGKNRTTREKRRDIRAASVQLKSQEREITRSNIVSVLILHTLWAGDPSTNTRLTHGSRGSSVYKNEVAERFINIECLWNVILQNLVAQALRILIKKYYGIDLDKAQHNHVAALLKCVTTGDFSNASDSIILNALRKLQPGWLLKVYEKYRSEFCLINLRDGSPAAYYEIHKLSSMGCGFTFEVLTLFLLQITRLYDPNSLVYGDDVMIFNDSWPQIAHVMGELGWKVNQKKTYHKLPLRESCGGFVLHGEYIRTYDFTWCHTILDAINSTNKLRRIAVTHRASAFGQVAQKYWELIQCSFPALLKGPCLDAFSDLPGWVEDPDWKRKHKSNSAVGSQRKKRGREIDYLCKNPKSKLLT